MGRRKIEIEYIREDRSRATTFIKRKSGLFKKAHELAILTGAQVAVIVFSQQDRLFTYGNEPCQGICKKYIANPVAYEEKGPSDYGADDHDESDDDAPEASSTRKNSLPGHARTNSSGAATAHSPSMTSRSRQDSLHASPRLPMPKGLTPKQMQGEIGRAESPASDRKRPHTPPTLEEFGSSPKFPKREARSRDVSDVRNSPHQLPRPASTSAMPDHQHPNHHMPPPQLSQPYQTLPPFSSPSQTYTLPATTYTAPSYNPPQQHPNRHFAMAPPLAIPSAPVQSDTQDGDRSQPLHPASLPHPGLSRVLLPTETGLTPIESPGNFANSLYSSTNGIGSKIPIPRISTDVGSLFYNWNTNEPGLSPATSMMLNQFHQQSDTTPTIGPLSAGAGIRGIAASLMPNPGAPISAGVLENFSPVTRSWLQTFSNSQQQQQQDQVPPSLTTTTKPPSPKDQSIDQS